MKTIFFLSFSFLFPPFLYKLQKTGNKKCNQNIFFQTEQPLKSGGFFLLFFSWIKSQDHIVLDPHVAKSDQDSFFVHLPCLLIAFDIILMYLII